MFQSPDGSTILSYSHISAVIFSVLFTHCESNIDILAGYPAIIVDVVSHCSSHLIVDLVDVSIT